MVCGDGRGIVCTVHSKARQLSTAVTPQPDADALRKEVDAFARTQFPQLTEALVNISSQSSDVAGLEASANEVVRVARELLGARTPISIRRERAEDGLVRPYVIIGNPKPSTVFIAHHDMVEPVRTGNEFDLVDGRTMAAGPGVHDDKGAIVMGLEAMRLLQAYNPNVFSQTAMYVGADEEIGSPAGRRILAELAQTASVALGLEGAEMDPLAPAPQPYGIKVGRMGYVKFFFEYQGLAGHAGYAKFSRADAGRAARYDMRKFDDWAAEHFDAVLNIGEINSPNVTNKIAEVARFGVECRSFSPERLQEFVEVVRSLDPCPSTPGVIRNVHADMTHPTWAEGPFERQAFSAVRTFAEHMNMALPEPQSVPGGGDINSVHVQTRLDGLGGMGYGDHSQDERLMLESITPAVLYAYGAASTLTNVSSKAASRGVHSPLAQRGDRSVSVSQGLVLG